jgi:hypothetical protein
LSSYMIICIKLLMFVVARYSIDVHLPALRLFCPAYLGRNLLD